MWKTVKLGEIAKAVGGNGFPKKYQGDKDKGIPFFKVSDMNTNGNEKFMFASNNYVDANGLKEMKAKLHPAGTIIFPKIGGAISTNKKRMLTIDAAFDNNVMGVVPMNEILPEYLYKVFLNLDLYELSNKAALPSITNGTVDDIEFALPPLAEQQRIVAKLDAAFAEIDKAIEVVDKKGENISALFDSSLELCLTGDEATVSDIFLSDTNFVNIIDGDRGTNYPNKSDFLDDGFCLFLNTKNVLKDGFNFDNKMFITAEKDTLLRKGKLMREDVVLTTRGTIGNIGHYSQDIENENIRINSGMVILRANPLNILPKYLFEILRSRSFKIQVEKLQKGAAQQHIPIKTLYEINFPVPNSLDEQNKIVKKIRAHQNQVKALAPLNLQKTCELKALKSAILAQDLQSEAA